MHEHKFGDVRTSERWKYAFILHMDLRNGINSIEHLFYQHLFSPQNELFQTYYRMVEMIYVPMNLILM